MYHDCWIIYRIRGFYKKDKNQPMFAKDPKIRSPKVKNKLFEAMMTNTCIELQCSPPRWWPKISSTSSTSNCLKLDWSPAWEAEPVIKGGLWGRVVCGIFFNPGDVPGVLTMLVDECGLDAFLKSAWARRSLINILHSTLIDEQLQLPFSAFSALFLSPDLTLQLGELLPPK